MPKIETGGRFTVPTFSPETVKYLDEKMEAARWKPDSPLAQKRFGGRRPKLGEPR